MDEPLSLLVGKTIESITETSSDNMLFVCTDGEAFEAYHMQDCCEDVRIYDIKGELQSLVGKEITEATENAFSDEFPEDMGEKPYDSWTVTEHVIKAGSVCVTVRWLGESNGYYSESVYFQRTHKPIELAE